MQPFTSSATSSPVLPAINFTAEDATENLAALSAFFRAPADGDIKNVPPFDRIARAAADVARAQEEVGFGQADLLVYLMTLVREQQSLKEREESTREVNENAPELDVAAWDVASHPPTALCSDPFGRLGVRQYIFDGLARVGVLLERLRQTFDFVFAEDFAKSALGSLRGDVSTRLLWAPPKRDAEPNDVPATRRDQFGRGKRLREAAEVAAAALGAPPAAAPPRPPRAAAAGVGRAVNRAKRGGEGGGGNDASSDESDSD